MKRILYFLIVLGFLFILSISAFIGLVYVGAFGSIPNSDDLKEISHAEATLVYSSDNKIIGKVYEENRTNVQFKDIPESLIQALVATEDARFYEHEGIDGIAMIRVLFKTILMGNRSSGGGSTISQQLSKNLYGRKTFGPLTMPVNKTKEAILANRIENIYSKDEILTLYLNTVPFGEDVYGIESAAERYFSKKVKDLEVEESAVLIGMLKANTYYNPRLYPEHAMQRRNVVLHQMVKYDYLPESKYNEIKNDSVVLNYNNMSQDNPYGYFLYRVKKKASDLLENETKTNGEPYNLGMDGLKIYTTVDATMQEAALNARAAHLKKLQASMDRVWNSLKNKTEVKKVIENQLKSSSKYKQLKKKGLKHAEILDELEVPSKQMFFGWNGNHPDSISSIDSVGYYLKMLQAAVLAMDSKTGAIKTWVGGNSYQYLPYDLVMSQHQLASTFKPFVYTAAIETGVKPCDWIDNEVKTYENYDGWKPENYDHTEGGYYSVKGALAKSMNVPTVEMYFQVGHDPVEELIEHLGFTNDLPREPAAALGVMDASLLELVRAYTAFSNEGKLATPYIIDRIETSTGEVIYHHESAKPIQVISEESTYTMQQLLKTVVDSGTATRLKSTYGVRGEWGGKTGTAQSYSDAWFVGFNNNIVTGVWVGTSSPVIHLNSGLGSGSSAALPIIGKMLRDSQKEKDLQKTLISKFETPNDFDWSILDCPFYRDEKGIEKLLDIFKKKKSSKKHLESEEDEKEKKGILKKIFGKKK